MSCYTRRECIQKAGVCLECNFLSFWKRQLEEHISGLRENAAVLRGLACCLPFPFLTNEKLYCFLHGRSTSTKPWPSGVRFVHLTLQKKASLFTHFSPTEERPPPKKKKNGYFSSGSWSEMVWRALVLSHPSILSPLKRLIIFTSLCNANVWRRDLFAHHSHQCWEMTAHQWSRALCKGLWSMINGWGKRAENQGRPGSPASGREGSQDQEGFVQRSHALCFSCKITH